MLASLLGGCEIQELRGGVTESLDGKTYLIVLESNPACENIKVNKEIWPHKIGEAGEVSPGVHLIECGGEIEFEIKEGTTFSFDYWGP